MFMSTGVRATSLKSLRHVILSMFGIGTRVDVLPGFVSLLSKFDGLLEVLSRQPDCIYVTLCEFLLFVVLGKPGVVVIVPYWETERTVHTANLLPLRDSQSVLVGSITLL